MLANPNPARSTRRQLSLLCSSPSESLDLTHLDHERGASPEFTKDTVSNRDDEATPRSSYDNERSITSRPIFPQQMLTFDTPTENNDDEGGFGLIDCLPDELLNMIFSYITTKHILSLRSVCRRWKRTLQEIHKVKLDVRFCKPFVNDDVLQSLVNQFAGVASLRLTGCIRITNTGFTTIAQCKELQTLILSNCMQVTDAVIDLISESCRSLQTLNLSQCHELTSMGLKTLAIRCRRLRNLNLGNCFRIDDAAVAVVVANCRKLKSLNLNGCSGLTTHVLKVMCESCVTIKFLNIEKCEGLLDDLTTVWPGDVPSERVGWCRELIARKPKNDLEEVVQTALTKAVNRNE